MKGAKAEPSGDVEKQQHVGLQPIIIGVVVHEPPFAIINQAGELEGFNIELAHALCQGLEQPCRIEALSFPEVMEGVSNGTLTIGLANLLKTPEREARVLFSHPIWRSTSSFVGKTSLERIPNDRLREKHVLCAVAFTRQSVYLHRLPGPQENVKDYPRHTDVHDALVRGDCDLFLSTTVNALGFLNSSQGQGFDYFGPPLDDPALSGDVHIIITPNRPEVAKKVDDIMDAIRRNGVYRALILRYFPFDIL